MAITKEKLIELIKGISLDPDYKKEFFEDGECDYSLRKNEMQIIKNTCSKYDVLYKYNGYNIYEGSNRISFEPIERKTEEVDIYEIKIHFENEPSVLMYAIDNYVLNKTYKIQGKKFFFIKHDIVVEEKCLNLNYKIECGNYSFDITTEDAEYLYKTCLDGMEKSDKLSDDKELEERFAKYNISIKD